MKKVLRYIWSGWKKVASKVARFQTILLLTFFYFLIVAPFGAVGALFGWDPLETRRKNLNKATNWKPVAHPEPDAERMRRQS